MLVFIPLLYFLYQYYYTKNKNRLNEHQFIKLEQVTWWSLALDYINIFFKELMASIDRQFNYCGWTTSLILESIRFIISIMNKLLNSLSSAQVLSCNKIYSCNFNSNFGLQRYIIYIGGYSEWITAFA